MRPTHMPRIVREICDDAEKGPAVLERLLMLLTVAGLVVLVMTTIGQGVLLLVLDVSARVASSR